MQDIERFNNELWNRLLAHRGHKLGVAVYGDLDNPANVGLECEDCGEVVLDAELYTICARVENQDELSEMPTKLADADITSAARSVGIDLAEIISSLKEQAQDRDSSVDRMTRTAYFGMTRQHSGRQSVCSADWRRRSELLGRA